MIYFCFQQYYYYCCYRCFLYFWINVTLHVTITGWVQKRLIKLYTDYCYKLSETPNMKLLKKLYDLEVRLEECLVRQKFEILVLYSTTQVWMIIDILACRVECICLFQCLFSLYTQVSDDEVTVSECELQDLSITPLLNALHAHKTFAMLDLSHNLLGNSI